ncbi:putative deacetylase LmbE-like domain-containing protein [Geopyxis carbonaria]|nr:putative deacetylase LmbE-like domain-containing protein [Geopyxis carbonaria]
MFISTLSLLPLLLAVWLYLRPPPTAPPRNKSILLLIAHPDDEAMFFAPTLLSLSAPHLHNTLSVLCLSSGDADGLGTVRKAELIDSWRVLGLGDATRVTVVEDERLPDSMDTRWDAGVVAEMVALHGGKQGEKGEKGGEKQGKQQVVLTFDELGVSGHVNHISLLAGARATGREVWTLRSVGVVRKYSAALDVATTLWLAGGSGGGSGGGTGSKGWVFVSGWAGVRTAQRAMTAAHVSQMRWFRWGWIWGSRYMVVNDVGVDTRATKTA